MCNILFAKGAKHFAPQEQQLTFVENDRISKYWSGSRKQFTVLKKQNQTDPITHYLFKTKLIKIKILESKKKYFDIQDVKQTKFSNKTNIAES